MLIDKISDGTSIKKSSPLTMLCLSFLCGILMTTPVNSAKVYHCLQANGTKAYQGRPCEKDKKTVAVTEQKDRKNPSTSNDQKNTVSIVGKWTLDGISSSLDGPTQTQEEKISWTFSADGKVTYQYQDNAAEYDYTIEGKTINMPGSSIGSFIIIKNEGSSAVWKTGTTYYFLTLSSII